jgi:tetratricopeptide (TPR) repeat protein
MAVIAMQEGRFADGIALAERALSAAPHARLHNMLGQAFIRMQQPDKALASFESAIALDPAHADAQGNRASVLADLDRLDEAVEGFDRALALRPSPEDWCNRGTALQDLDRFEEALESCDRALALRPGMAMAHSNRANVLRDLAQLEHAAGADPSAKFEAALAAYNKAIECEPQFAPSFLGRGIVHLLRGDWSAGFRDYEYRLDAGPPTFTPPAGPRWMGERLTREAST